MIGAALFVGALAFNVQMNFANKQTSDVALNNIEALTASAEEDPDFPGCCENIWTVTYEVGTNTAISCVTGGSYACPICCF